jgi:hypothetical protein
MSLKPTSIPTKTLSASITALSSSFKLNNILGWNGLALTSSDFGTQAYCVFRNANRSRIEIMEFDPATVANTSITILRRGLSFDGDLTTEVTANKFAWTKGDTFVDMGTDAPQVFQWMKEYIDAASIAGAVDASDTAKGIVEVATRAEVAAGTATGATGATLVTPTSFGPVIETTSGATHSLTTIADQRVVVWVKGQFTGVSTDTTVTLSYNGVSKDTVLVDPSSSGDNVPFALMYTETPGAATADITVTTSGGSVADVKIIVLKI